MSIARSITKGIGALTPAAWRSIAAAATFFERHGDRLAALVNGFALGLEIEPARKITIKIDGAAKISGSAKWRYAWSQVRRTAGADTWTAVSGGLSGTTSLGYALNRAEGGNTAGSAFGYDASDTTLTGHADYVAGPVPVGTIVELTITRAADGSLSYEFDGGNLIDGTCPSESELAPSANPLDVYNCLDEEGPAGTPSIIRTGHPNTEGLRIIGVDGQVADLETWEDEIGTILARVKADGTIEIAGYDALTRAGTLKTAARVATTAAITLSGTQTIDGVALSVGDRVLVRNQASASANGLYTVASGAWTRTEDADADAAVASGLSVAIAQGTINGGRSFILTTAGPITLGTTALTFSRMDAAAGSSGQVMFNSGGLVTGSASMTWDDTNKAFVLNGGPSGAMFSGLIPTGGTIGGLRLRQTTTGNGAFILLEYAGGTQAVKLDEWGSLLMGSNGIYGSLFSNPGNTARIDFGTSGEIHLCEGTFTAPEKRISYYTSGHKMRVWYDGTTYYCDYAVDSSGNATITPSGGTLTVSGILSNTAGGATARVGRGLSANTADSNAVANLATETNLDQTYTVPAALLNAAGRTLRVTATGIVGSTGSPNLTLRLKAGSTALWSSGALRCSGTTGKRWTMQWLVTCRSTGASGALNTVAVQAVIDATTANVPASAATVDLTAAFTLQVSAEWSAASASNTTKIESLIVEAINC